jgi:hypothetical protein
MGQDGTGWDRGRAGQGRRGCCRSGHKGLAVSQHVLLPCRLQSEAMRARHELQLGLRGSSLIGHASASERAAIDNGSLRLAQLRGWVCHSD